MKWVNNWYFSHYQPTSAQCLPLSHLMPSFDTQSLFINSGNSWHETAVSSYAPIPSWKNNFEWYMSMLREGSHKALVSVCQSQTHFMVWELNKKTACRGKLPLTIWSSKTHSQALMKNNVYNDILKNWTRLCVGD